MDRVSVEHKFGWGPKTLPRPSEADMKRLAGMVERGELRPVLNHTKWAELRTEVLAAPSEQHPQFRARSVFAPPDFCTAWDGITSIPLQTWSGWSYKLPLRPGYATPSSVSRRMSSA